MADFDTLRPWLESETPNSQGEIGMHCPLPDHGGDTKRSASVNMGKGVYHCQVCGGGRIEDLVDFLEHHPDVQPGGSNGKSKSFSGNGSYHEEKTPLSEGQVAGWVSALRANEDRLGAFQSRRGLSQESLDDFEIGWNRDAGGGAYTIPVRNAEGDLANVRFYQLDPTDDRRKIWGLPGRNAPVLFPGQMLNHLGHTVVICEGELDALLTLQHGFDAVTRTGAAKVWNPSWNNYFQDKNVYLCHDMDEAGQEGNRIVAAHLEGVASEIYCVQLPYEITPKHGKDLTDYWLDGHVAEDFYQLLFEAEPWSTLPESGVQVVDATVLDSFDSANVGSHLKMQVTITGKQNNPYLLPHTIDYSCDKQAGAKCGFCPMNSDGYDGKHSLTVHSSDPLLMKFMNSTDAQVADLLRAQVTPVKCGRLNTEVVQQRTVEELFVRPSVDRYINSTESGDYAHRKIISVGTYDTMPNNTVEVVGSIYPSPRSQHNEFQAWELNRTETSLDRFEQSPATHKMLQVFQPRRMQSPLSKLGVIAEDLAHHVTHIYGRPEMHAFMDLVFHSVLGFNFDGKHEPRGWLDGIIIGDTRTGKTEAANGLIGWYGSGEYVSGETASFAGVVGGLQQYGSKEWVVTWGAVPINDRRLVALDEVSGLSTDQIAQMSSIRSSGEAQLTKIHSERTMARTRLLWLGNPRNGMNMADFAYGVNAIKQLIGNNEDIARFDLAMAVTSGDVPAEMINTTHKEGAPKYTQEAYRTLLHWAWSRRPEHIRFAKNVEKYIYEQAIEVGRRYIAQPPLVQSQNIRQKITRLAVALAVRLYSTEDGVHVNVCKEHVRDAIKFMDRVYGMEVFGYGALSANMVRDREIARQSVPTARQYFTNYLPLAETLLDQEGQFQATTLRERLNITSEEANAIIQQLYSWRMLQRGEKGMNRMMPELNEVIREVIKL